MWDGVTYVEPSRRPVIHEGFGVAHLVVGNAGPGTVDLMIWNEPMRDRHDPPSLRMRMPPGDTRSTSGPMIAVALSDAPQQFAQERPCFPQFAAVAWRVVR